jgi:hypothetical protein
LAIEVKAKTGKKEGVEDVDSDFAMISFKTAALSVGFGVRNSYNYLRANAESRGLTIAGLDMMIGRVAVGASSFAMA